MVVTRRPFPFLILAVVLLRPAEAGIVYTARTYRASGRSWRQVAAIDPATGRARGLTSSLRHHRHPVCSADGNTVWFLSSGKADEDWPDRQLWRLDRRTAAEKLLYSLPAAPHLDDYWRSGFQSMQRVLGGAADQAVLLLLTSEPGGAIYRFDGRLQRLARACEAWPAPDGSAIAYKVCQGAEVRVMDASGKTLASLGACGAAFWSVDGKQLACAGEGSLRIFEPRGWRQVRTVPLAGVPAGSLCFAWSPDGARLLCGAPGRESNSTVRYSDYGVLDARTGHYQALPEGGNQAFWADASHVVYATPRELSGTGALVRRPAGKLLTLEGTVRDAAPSARERGVWTQHLKIVDVPRLKVTALTSGLESAGDAAVCGVSR